MRIALFLSFVALSLFPGAAGAQAPSILLYGDSLTAGYLGDPGYAPRLGGLGWNISNRAAAGQQKATGVWILEQALASGAISAANEAVVLFWGSNDLDGGAVLNPACLTESLPFWRCQFEVVRPALLEHVAAIQALGLHVVVALPPPQFPPAPPENNASLELTRFFVKRDLEDLGVEIVDFYEEFNAMANPQALMSADGVHLNDFGDLYLTVRIDQALRAGGLVP